MKVTHFGRFVVKGPCHSETLSHEKCYLYRTTSFNTLCEADSESIESAVCSQRVFSAGSWLTQERTACRYEVILGELVRGDRLLWEQRNILGAVP